MTAPLAPYLRAHALYQANQDHSPDITWTHALDFHFQHGVIYSTPALFIMGRRVAIDTPPEVQLSLSIINSPSGPVTWHIWAAAGDMATILRLARDHGAQIATYQRRNRQRLHTLHLSRLL